MGNTAALKNNLTKNISELFTIQVQADFDRDIRKFDPNKYGAALRQKKAKVDERVQFPSPESHFWPCLTFLSTLFFLPKFI